MPTTKHRINLTISPEIEEVLTILAKRDSTRVSTKALELLKLALEIEEDRALEQIAIARDIPGTKYLKMDEVWK